jgi:hypothetical protein
VHRPRQMGVNENSVALPSLSPEQDPIQQPRNRTQRATLRNGLYLILLRVRFGPPEGVQKSFEQGSLSDIRMSPAQRRVPALILAGRPLEYFPAHCESLDRTCIRDCDGHDHLPADGHPHEGIPESGEHASASPRPVYSWVRFQECNPRASSSAFTALTAGLIRSWLSG